MNSNNWLNIQLLSGLLGAFVGIALLAAMVAPAHSQETNLNAFDYEDLMAECSIMLHPDTCERLNRLGEKAFLAFAMSLEYLITDGTAKASKELDRMLNELEHGFPAMKKKGTWI